MKLYKVTLQGMNYKIGSGMVYGESYVVADNPDEAYQIVRKDLNERNIGFDHERELKTIELIADAKKYNDIGYRLYIKQDDKKE